MNRILLLLLLSFFMLPVAGHSQLFINEWMAANTSSIADENGDFEDWIEIYNAGNTAVDLAGYYISDNPANKTLHQIAGGNPALTTVPANGYLLLWADDDVAEGLNHLAFKLGANGESILLTAADGMNIVDEYTFGAQTPDFSFGRYPDGSANWQLFPSATPLQPNDNSASGYQDISITIPITNPNDDAEQVGSTGAMLLNSSDIEMVKDGSSTLWPGFRFRNVPLPSNADIVNAYIQFTADEVGVGNPALTIYVQDIGDAPEMTIAANNLFFRTYLQEVVQWNPAPWTILDEAGVAQRTSNLKVPLKKLISRPDWSEGNSILLFVTGNVGTRTAYAYETSLAKAAKLVIEARIPLATVKMSNVYINEVAASSTALLDAEGKREDWLEIHNANAQPVNLQGLYLTDNINDLDKFRIQASITVPAGGFVTFFADDDEDQGPMHVGFDLKGSGEKLALVQKLNTGLTIIDTITYDSIPFEASYGRQMDGSADWTTFGAPTPTASNTGAALYLSEPVLSVPSGKYASSQSVAMSHPVAGVSIKYTMDGSLPSHLSPTYSAPVTVSSSGSLRARAFKSGYANSHTTDNAYLINVDVNVPIVHLTTDPKNFYDDSIGIYVTGTNGVQLYCAPSPANWAQDWDRPVNVKMFLPDGTMVFDVNGEVAINGVCSRNYKMKSLGLSFKEKQYGDAKIKYALFPERTHDDYFRLKLRNGGQDYTRTGFRDLANHRFLFGKADVDLQASRPVLVYLNGSFLGLHNIQEKFTKEYFATNHGADENKIDIIKSPGVPWAEIKEGNWEVFNQLFSFVETSDLANDDNYAYFESQVDINSFMNYWIAMTYMANTDWPANNLTVWRERKMGKKWRYCVVDTDGSTLNNLTTQSSYNYNTFQTVNDANSTNWPNHKNSTLFLRKLLERPDFRNEYIQRTCSFIHLIYAPERTHSIINDIKQEYAPNVPAHLALLGSDGAMGGSQANWNRYVDSFKVFFVQRPVHFRNHLKNFYGLNNGFYNLTINYTDTTGGDVFVNWTKMPIPYNYQGTYFRNMPLRLTAVAKPDYVFSHWLETGDTNALIDYVGNEDSVMLTPIFTFQPCNGIIIGSACNDNEACTINDVYDEACNCVGTLQDADGDNICVALDCDDNNAMLPSPAGTPCDDGLICTTNDISDGNCNCLGTTIDVDNDGYCVAEDCDDNNPNIPQPVGTPCNDGNTSTTNDIIQEGGCICAGNIVLASELINLYQVRLFPNPTGDDFKITASEDIEQVELYNVEGRLHSTKNTLLSRKEVNYSVLNMQKGIYLVRIIFFDGNIATLKLIVL